MKTKQYSIWALIVALATMIGSFTFLVPAFAEAAPTFATHGERGLRPTLIGTVASVSGNTLTVASNLWQGRDREDATSSYTVDASHATVTKNGATSSVSAIAVGDRVMIQGTLSGTNVTAVVIRDGAMGIGLDREPRYASTTPIIAGNGEPVIGGTVTTISGSTLTVTTKSGITYTVDASGATVVKGHATTTVATIATGDAVVVQGTVNGTSVTAASVIDQVATPAQAENGVEGAMHRFFGAMGGFFHRFFGFF